MTVFGNYHLRSRSGMKRVEVTRHLSDHIHFSLIFAIHAPVGMYVLLGKMLGTERNLVLRTSVTVRTVQINNSPWRVLQTS